MPLKEAMDSFSLQMNYTFSYWFCICDLRIYFIFLDTFC
jgi:hypothetical protein